MQVAKPSCFHPTHNDYAMNVGLLSGALVTAPPAGQDRLYGVPHYKPVTPPVSR